MTTIKDRGFASMTAERLREVASMGGKAVNPEMRSFSTNRKLAAEAGRKGGMSVPHHKRSFSKHRALASEAGRKGGSSLRTSKEVASEAVKVENAES